jgi:glycosyltransferase involved in cell wall biosynthesis
MITECTPYYTGRFRRLFMKILAFTAGAARMYCGSCLRDNALAAELKRLGHDVILSPLYTPTRTDENNVSDPRVFLNGIGVCLEQHAAYFRRPRLLDRLWDTPWMLKLATRSSIKVDPHMLGEMTVSMLRGEQGYQLKEIRKLTGWLASETPPDIVTLPNSLLIGLARPIRQALKRPICCTLQGEELFLDQVPEPYHTQSLDLIRAALDDVDGFVAVSQYSAAYWRRRLGIPESRMHVVPLGIHVDGFDAAPRARSRTFTVGFLARVSPEKGLHTLAEAYVRLRRGTDFNGCALEAAGYLAREHRGYLRGVGQIMKRAGLADEFHYRGELNRPGKIAFLRGLDLLSVPTTYDEPKGLPILEAMAAGVPCVQPRRGAFPEILEQTGGGILTEPDGLGEAIYNLWKNRDLAACLGDRGAEGVRAHYTAAHMAARAAEVYAQYA